MLEYFTASFFLHPVKKFSTGQSSGVVRVGTIPEADYTLLQERERRVQSELLSVQAENVELRFRAEDADRAQREAGRLKERAADLEKYVDFLKQEKLQLAASMGDQSVSLSLSSTGNVKRV